MEQREIDRRAKELFDVLNRTDRPDIAFATIRNAITDVAKEEKPATSSRSSAATGYKSVKKFTMDLEPHTPSNPKDACKECILGKGMFCLDRSYCEFRKTGKTWKKAL